jgi:tetratricopeptide (TPR) repeat protein
MSARSTATGLSWLVLVLLASSCARVPTDDARSGVTRAEAHLQRKQFQEAIIGYRNALKTDPSNGTARLNLARAYVGAKDYKNAYLEYMRAGDLLPDDLDVQAEVGNILLLGRYFEDAKTRARSILQKNPSHLAGLILLGNALAGLQDLENAVSVAERVASHEAASQGSYVNLGALRLARGEYDEAEKAFTTAVVKNPRSLSAHLALANFYRAAGKLDASERAFQQALEVDPQNFQANRAIAAFYVESNRSARAEPYLRHVAETLDDESSWLELTDLLLAGGTLPEAETLLPKLSSLSGRTGLVELRIARIKHGAGKTAEAHDILKKLVQQRPNNAEALALDAELLLKEHRVDAALATARDAVKADPNSEDARFILGRIHAIRRDFGESEKAFKEIVRTNPAALEARVELSKLHVERREIDSGIGAAREASRINPASIDARLALVSALLVREEDRHLAFEEIAALVREFPFSAAVATARGKAHLVKQDRAAARRDFERALELDPQDLDALSQLLALDLSTGRSLGARRRLLTHLEQRPDDPALLLMTAKVLVADRQHARAETLLRRVAALDPANFESYVLLGQLLIAQKRLDEAAQAFAAIIERDPKSADAHTMLGLLMHAQRRVPEAVAHYEKALEADSHAATAANNLAWLFAENDQQLERAFALARTAYARQPTNPVFVDTLGWVYFKRGVLALAVTNLEQAVQLDGTNPLYAYHLGVAYAKQGSDAKARRALQRALELKPDFERGEDAKRILATLVY